MPRKQRFKPSRKPKQVEPVQGSTTGTITREGGAMQTAVTEAAMPSQRADSTSASGSET
jgi:hypothetical protein